jgi:hypothetical protein
MMRKWESVLGKTAIALFGALMIYFGVSGMARGFFRFSEDGAVVIVSGDSALYLGGFFVAVGLYVIYVLVRYRSR